MRTGLSRIRKEIKNRLAPRVGAHAPRVALDHDPLYSYVFLFRFVLRLKTEKKILKRTDTEIMKNKTALVFDL